MLNFNQLYCFFYNASDYFMTNKFEKLMPVYRSIISGIIFQQTIVCEIKKTLK